MLQTEKKTVTEKFLQVVVNTVVTYTFFVIMEHESNYISHYGVVEDIPVCDPGSDTSEVIFQKWKLQLTFTHFC